MNEKKNATRNLGRMTDEEYEALQIGGDKICQDTHKRYHGKDLRRLTDEEYRNLPYGNKAFYKQFTK